MTEKKIYINLSIYPFLTRLLVLMSNSMALQSQGVGKSLVPSKIEPIPKKTACFVHDVIIDIIISVNQ